MLSLRTAAVLALSVALPFAISSRAFANSNCDAIPGNLVTNCGFESGSFSGWNMNDPSGNSFVDGHYPNSGTYAATLGAFGSTPGTLSQTLTDTAGQTYNFSFSLDNEVAVDANGVPYPGGNAFGVTVTDTNGGVNNLFGPQSITQSNNYSLYSFQFVGTGTDTITFSINNVPSYYDLDDVDVNAQTPEPSSLALMGTGAVVFAALTRRTIKKV